jgi:hypothetical protein
MTAVKPENMRDASIPKRRIHQEESKTRQTSHWDWDYLPLAELERIRRGHARAPAENARRATSNRRRALVGWIFVLGGLTLLGLLAVAAWTRPLSF